MTAGAKSFGSFLSGVVNKAGAKIKETVKDNVSPSMTLSSKNVAWILIVNLNSLHSIAPFEAVDSW